MNNQQVMSDDIKWTEEMCDDILAVKEALDKLKDNENFNIFRKFYIEKRRVDLCREMGTHNLLGGPNRQLAIEALIAVDNFEYFIDTWIKAKGEIAKMYKSDFIKKRQKKDN